MIEEVEWYGVCCTAPPLYTLDESGEEPIGLCMHCRDNTTFELIKEDEDE